MNICLITDGGRTRGMGHVQQSITIAGRLRSSATIEFLTKSEDAVLGEIHEAGFPATRLGSDSEILTYLYGLDADIIVFDKIDVDEQLALAIKNSLRGKLVIFTNLTNANRHADIAVTADIGSRFKNICYVDRETNTRYYYGPKYWILRKQFFDYKRKRKARPSCVERILLIFGGSDPSNLTSAAVEQLLRMKGRFQLEVVLGSQYSHDMSLQRVLGRFAEKRPSVTIHKNIKNVAELMYRADLTLASPGLSAFESLCVGTPIIVMPHDRLQRDTYDGFMRVLVRDEAAQLEDMIERADFTYPDEPHIISMEIGEGVDEIVGAILGLAN